MQTSTLKTKIYLSSLANIFFFLKSTLELLETYVVIEEKHKIMKMYEGSTVFLQNFQNFSKLFKFFQNFSKLFKIFQNLSKLFKTFQNFSKLFKTFQNFSKLFKTFKNFLCLPTLLLYKCDYY